MHVFDAEAAHAALPYEKLIARLREAFRAGGEAPLRQHYTIQNPGAAPGTLLLMPAWQAGRHIGIKAVSVFPDNARSGLPSVLGTYLLLDATSGEPRAQIDAVALTLRRTGCASALAADYLARKDAARLLMIGAGALAPHLVRAHACVRRYRRVEIWNRTQARAQALVEKLADLDAAVAVADNLEAAVRAADTISCATLSRDPLVQGEWLKPGAHVDLVGGFTPQMREADDAVLKRAAIYVDTRAGALSEAGDLTDPIRRGVIAPSDVRGDLFDLVRAGRFARERDEQITVFKSVGYALEDLAAAELVAESAPA